MQQTFLLFATQPSKLKSQGGSSIDVIFILFFYTCLCVFYTFVCVYAHIIYGEAHVRCDNLNTKRVRRNGRIKSQPLAWGVFLRSRRFACFEATVWNVQGVVFPDEFTRKIKGKTVWKSRASCEFCRWRAPSKPQAWKYHKSFSLWFLLSLSSQG